MSKGELDRLRAVYAARGCPAVAERYSLFHPGELYMLQRREQALLALLSRHGRTDLALCRVLEIGCGRGARLADWVRWGGRPDHLVGIDLMEPFLQEARDTLPRVGFAAASGDHLPFADRSFDIVVQLTVFTSILAPELRQGIAAEMRRVARPEGLILWYDFRYPNPRNPDVRPVGRRELAGLFPGCRIDLRRVTLVPPLARRLAPLSFTLCRALELLPALRSHYLAAITPG